MPMHISHDITRPLSPTNVQAGVERLDDGHLAAWIEFDTDANAWAMYEAERDAAGALGGFSFSVTRPIDEIVDDDQSQVVVAADAGYFEDSTITAASEVLSIVGVSRAERLYQFAAGPDAKVIVEFIMSGLAGIALNMIASALYDAAKLFLKPGRPTVFNIIAKQRRNGRRVLKLHLATDNPEVAQCAMSQAAEMLGAAANGTFAYDDEANTFRQIDSSESTSEAVDDEPSSEDGSEFLSNLGISDRASGLRRARDARAHLLSVGRNVLVSASSYTVELVVFSGLFARAQAFHEGVMGAIDNNNAQATFTLLKAYTENATAILYLAENPARLDSFWHKRPTKGKISTEQLIRHAKKRAPGLRKIYKQLKKYASPTAKSILASHTVSDANSRSIVWRSAPSFKSESDAIIACAWTVELAEASAQFLSELAATWQTQRSSD
jgi:hypothetical protein